MRRGTLYVWLPILGAVSAVIAFAAAQPYADTLNRPWLPKNDPRAHFSTGTAWDTVEHVVFGVLLLGSFALVISAASGGWRRAWLPMIKGVILGGVLVPLGNSAADLIGIELERSAGVVGILAGPLFWALLVPSAIAIGLVLSLGPTPQRLQRAGRTIIIGFGASAAGLLFVAPIFGAMAAITTIAKSGGQPLTDGVLSAQSSIPVWQAIDIMLGVITGFVFAFAENAIRAASVKLILGRNEGREYFLDNLVTTIGSGEAANIRLDAQYGAVPRHAAIHFEAGQFVLKALAIPTLVNGKPVDSHRLRPGDEIGVGKAILLFADKKVLVPGVKATGAPTLLVHSMGTSYALSEGLFTIGREPGCTIAFVHDPRMSRKHGELIVDADKVRYRDLGSTGGSYVNGKRIQHVVLRIGDTLQIGGTTLLAR